MIKFKKGFTLVEIMMAVAILGIIAAALLRGRGAPTGTLVEGNIYFTPHDTDPYKASIAHVDSLAKPVWTSSGSIIPTAAEVGIEISRPFSFRTTDTTDLVGTVLRVDGSGNPVSSAPPTRLEVVGQVTASSTADTTQAITDQVAASQVIQQMIQSSAAAMVGF